MVSWSFGKPRSKELPGISVDAAGAAKWTQMQLTKGSDAPDGRNCAAASSYFDNCSASYFDFDLRKRCATHL